MLHSHGVNCCTAQQQGPTDTRLTWVPLGHSAPSLIPREQEQEHIRRVRKCPWMGIKMEVLHFRWRSLGPATHSPLHTLASLFSLF